MLNVVLCNGVSAYTKGESTRFRGSTRVCVCAQRFTYTRQRKPVH
ncbi:hypothetical protein HMPREF3190_00700 [Umbribacter vaginalis]|nr:hypothetical protein HMPREF3190_00700 [Coriobacteriales bacterium DNF00809]